MTCDKCKRPFSYSYFIDLEYWKIATSGVKEGHLCAHCVLESIGGVDWQIIFNEALAVIRTDNPIVEKPGGKGGQPSRVIPGVKPKEFAVCVRCKNDGFEKQSGWLWDPDYHTYRCRDCGSPLRREVTPDA